MTNHKNVLKVRQICFIILAFLPVTKLAALPGFLADVSGEALWISALFAIMIDLVALFLSLYLSKKHPEATLLEIVEKGAGTIAAKILFSILSLFFLLKAALPILEQKIYVEKTLYEVMPKPFIFYPLFIVAFYACLKGLKIFGRVADITVWITIISFIVAMFLSVPSGEYTNLLPLFKKPFYNLVNGAFRSVLWFSDGVYLLMFLGTFKNEKHYAKKMVFSYLGASFATVAFMAVFYAIYGSVSPSQTFALPTMMVFSVNATNAGRFDFIAIFLMLFSQVFAIILPLQICTDCLKYIFNARSRFYPSLLVNSALAMTALFFGNKFEIALSLGSRYLPFFFLFVSVAIPLVLTLIPKRRENEVA